VLKHTIVLALVAAGCGSSSDATTAPSVAQVAGAWRGTTRVSTVTGTSMIGTEVDTLSVNVSDTTTAVGTVTITSDFTATKQ
jgi:hypothetical protein